MVNMYLICWSVHEEHSHSSKPLFAFPCCPPMDAHTTHRGDSRVLVQNSVSCPTPRESSRCANTKRAQAHAVVVQLRSSEKIAVMAWLILLLCGRSNHCFVRTPGILNLVV